MSSTTATKLLTADEFAKLPEPIDGSKQELVRGEIISMAPPGFIHGKVQGRVYFALARQVPCERREAVGEQNCDSVLGGLAVPPECLFDERSSDDDYRNREMPGFGTNALDCRSHDGSISCASHGYSSQHNDIRLEFANQPLDPACLKAVKDRTADAEIKQVGAAIKDRVGQCL